MKYKIVLTSGATITSKSYRSTEHDPEPWMRDIKQIFAQGYFRHGIVVIPVHRIVSIVLPTV